jgi:mannose-1-phosphate guanylyltransferase
MPHSIPQAIVLTAGLGIRLRPLTAVRAKPAIPVAGEPMIRRIIAGLSAHGVADLVLNLHHLPDTLTSVVGDGRDLGVRVRYSWEPRILGSAGGPRRAIPLLAAVDAPFFIVNGDTITDVDLTAMTAAHVSSGALVTLALVPNREFLRYGGVAIDARGRVIGFPRRGPAAKGSHHFIGVQIASAQVFAALPEGEPASSIGGIYDAMIAERPGSVHGFVSEAGFWDVGTVEDYWKTARAFADREGTADLADRPGRNVRIDPTARVTRSILWDDVAVGAGAVIEDCILTDGVSVLAGAEYRRQILLAGTYREPRTQNVDP